MTLAAVFTIACGGHPTAPSGVSAGRSDVSPSVAAYLDEMLGLMRRYALNRNTIDWNAFEEQVFQSAGLSRVRTVGDAHSAIQVALGLLKDGHSFYVAPSGAGVPNPNSPGCQPLTWHDPPLPPSIGYVQVGSFNGNGPAATDFAATIQTRIREQDRPDLAGWIVDLRGNLGGNMWPMLAGVGPLLGEGEAGFFIDPDGVSTTWAYANGAATLQGQVLEVVSPAYRLQRPNPRVAVLMDTGTASSGEAIAVAFRGRPNSQSYGTRSCGLSTANAFFLMSDGARLVLTTATFADRVRRPYGGSLFPDDPAGSSITRAVEWLLGA
ncbi:MAG: S41 family peptidase [Vicinamibacterales bacterium]